MTAMPDRSPVVVVAADAPVLTRRTLGWLSAIGGVSFAVALVLLALGPEMAEPPSFGADAFSRSAIGHAALVALLRDLDLPVTLCRHDTASRTRAPGVLVVAEPGVRAGAGAGGGRRGDDPERAHARLVALLEEAEGAVLLVLPKRVAVPSREDEGWAREVAFLSPDEVARPLRALGLGSVSVRRLEARPRLDEVAFVPGPADGPADGLVPGPGAALPALPDLAADAQVIVPDLEPVEPLVACREGIVLGRFEAELHPEGPLIPAIRREVYVLSDPDVIANHGLGRGDNAAFAIALLERLRGGTGPIVIDETHHGHVVRPSIWGELLRFPLAALTLHGLLAAGLAALAGAARFGAPIPPPPAHEPGKGQLIGHTADLLAHGGHGDDSLRRLLDDAVHGVGRALRAPAGLDRAALVRWLDDAARARGRPAELEGLAERVRGLRRGRPTAVLDADLLRAAQAIHGWKEGMLHGPQRGS